MTQATTRLRRNQAHPTIATPDTTRQSPAIQLSNHFDILAKEDNSSDPDSSMSNGSGVDTTPELDIEAADRSVLNNGTAESDSDSDSSMSMTQDDSCLVSQETLKSRMEALEQGMTTPKLNPKCMDALVSLQDQPVSVVCWVCEHSLDWASQNPGFGSQKPADVAARPSFVSPD